ncbi:MAG: ZIP family metal transporter [Candidatus Bathyarchaeia archaeon]|jgi:ZIP family zinc transporter
MNFNAFLLAIITCFSTLLGGAFAARRRKNIGILGAFAAGVLITTSLLDLLPQTFRLATSVNVLLEDVMALTVVGFLFLYIVSRVITHHVFNEDGEYSETRHPLGGLFATSQLSVHSFIDGLAIGFGFAADIHVGIIIAIAVICHDFTDGLSAVAVMLNSGNSLRNSLRMLFLDAIAPVLGVAATLFVEVQQYYIVLLLSFFAGGFLYLGASDLLPEAHEKNPQVLTIISCISGFVLIFILTYVLSNLLNI